MILFYQNPRVPPSTIGTFYPGKYFSSRPGRGRRGKGCVEKKVRLKCNLVERFVSPPGKLLEIGSANGDFLVSMRKRGWDVQGVEPSYDAAELVDESITSTCSMVRLSRVQTMVSVSIWLLCGRYFRMCGIRLPQLSMLNVCLQLKVRLSYVVAT